MVQSQDTALYTRIIEERFPDYESVFPQDNDKKVKLSREELLATVRRVSIFSNKTTHQIAFRLDQDGLEVSTEDIETVSNAREKVSCEYEGDPLLIGYNSNYLRDILMHLDGDRLIGEFKSAVSAAIFYHEQTQENEDLTMLLMPIRLND
jgi:DNA polymerase-3 subunit beta